MERNAKHNETAVVGEEERIFHFNNQSYSNTEGQNRRMAGVSWAVCLTVSDPPESWIEFPPLKKNKNEKKDEVSQAAQWLRIRLPSRRCGFDPWVGKIPWSRNWQPSSVFLPGKSYGQRSLVGHSPWGHKEWAQLRDWACKQKKKRQIFCTPRSFSWYHPNIHTHTHTHTHFT